LLLEFIFIGIFVFVISYLIFFILRSSIKAEKDFSLDVYRYLSRRYSKTVIVDYGGISTDPIIQSRDAGPFKLVEVKVVTHKETNRTDQDLILRGEVDHRKYQKGDNEPFNLSLSLESRWDKIPRYKKTSRQEVEIGIPRFDDRFLILTENLLFAQNMLVRADLGKLILRSFDLEGFDLGRVQDVPVIQVRMETMSSNSFVQAFNILLGTVGALSETGYLTRGIRKREKNYLPPPSRIPKAEKEIPIYEEIRIVSNDKQEKVVSTNEETGKIAESYLEISADFDKPIEKIVPVKPVSTESPYQPLFSSIRYQAKKVEFEPSQVKIFTFSRAAQEIVVIFPSEELAHFNISSVLSPSLDFELQIKFQEKARSTDWSDSWKDITISGHPKIIEKLELHTGIAHRITSTGHCTITTKGQLNKGIDVEITVPQTIRGVNAGYSLLKDIIWFFELIFI
jgi:hypothetical protein